MFVGSHNGEFCNSLKKPGKQNNLFTVTNKWKGESIKTDNEKQSFRERMSTRHFLVSLFFVLSLSADKLTETNWNIKFRINKRIHSSAGLAEDIQFRHVNRIVKNNMQFYCSVAEQAKWPYLRIGCVINWGKFYNLKLFWIVLTL